MRKDEKKTEAATADDRPAYKVTLEIPSPNGVADSETGACDVTVTCLAWDDATQDYTKPLSGEETALIGDPQLFFAPDEGKTDANGQFQSKVLSDYPGSYGVEAVAGDVDNGLWIPSDQKDVTFDPNSQDTEQYCVDVKVHPPSEEGDPYMVEANCYLKVDDDALDNTPIPNALVEFSASSDLNIDPSSGHTDPNGLFDAAVWPKKVGSYQITATASGGDDPKFPGPKQGQTTADVQPIYELLISAPDSSGNAPPADGQSAQVVTATLSVKVWKGPAVGQPIAFSGPDDATFTPQQGETNSNGEFSSDVTATQSGTHMVTATATGPGLHESMEIQFSEAPHVDVTIDPSKQKADGVSKSTINVACYWVTDDNKTQNIRGATVTFDGDSALEFSSPESVTGEDGKCSVTVTTRASGNYDITVTAMGGTPTINPPIKRDKSVTFTSAPEYYLDLTADSTSGWADGSETITVTAHAYDKDQKGESPINTKVTFSSLPEGLTFDPASATTDAYYGKATTKVSTTTAGPYYIHATATGGDLPAGGTLPETTPPLITFGTDNIDVQLSISFVEGSEQGTIYANGNHQAPLLVKYLITDPAGIDQSAFGKIELINYAEKDDAHPELSNAGWKISDQAGPYIVFIPSLSSADAIRPKSPGSPPPRADIPSAARPKITAMTRDGDNTQRAGESTFYVSADRLIQTLTQIGARVNYKGKTYYTESGTDKGAYIELKLLTALQYDAADLNITHGQRSHDDQGPDDDSDTDPDTTPSGRHPNHYWRQMDYALVLNNTFKIQDASIPSAGLCYTRRIRSFYCFKGYIWPVDAQSGNVYLWQDMQGYWPRNTPLIQSPGIKMSIIVSVRQGVSKHDETYLLDPVVFHDIYGNTGKFYPNCDLPTTYKALLENDSNAFKPIVPNYNGSTGDPSTLVAYLTCTNRWWTWSNDKFLTNLYYIYVNTTRDDAHCTFTVGVDSDDFPAAMEIVARYTSTEVHVQYHASDRCLDIKGHSNYLCGTATYPWSAEVYWKPIWNASAFRLFSRGCFYKLYNIKGDKYVVWVTGQNGNPNDVNYQWKLDPP